MTTDRRRQVEAVALEALARGEGERAAYLAAACPASTSGAQVGRARH
jgi:hypothetical protein